MVKTVATIGFISIVGLFGLIVAFVPTVADGRVVGADLLSTFKPTDKRLDKIECDRRIPIGIDGAAFRCVHTYTDGSAVEFRYTLDRSGALRGVPVGAPFVPNHGTRRGAP